MEKNKSKYNIKDFAKYMLIALFAITYSISIFNTTTVTFTDQDQTQVEYSHKVYLGEISKLVFPQAINTESSAQSIIPVLFYLNDELANAFVITNLLNNLSYQKALNYLKLADNIDLSLKVEDVIYPFHYFW